MVTVDTIGRVRRAYWVQKKKIKAIARELRLSRGTVRRIVRSGETVLTYERKEQPLPKLGPFVEQLDKLLEANMAKRKRERLTTKRLTEQLKEAGYAGGYDSVRRYAQRWRQEHAAESAAAFVCAAAPVSDPSTQRSAPIRVLLSTHDAHDGKPHKYKR